MADFRRGIKAGAAAAAAYLLSSVIIAAIGRTFWYPSDCIYAAGLGIQLGLTDAVGIILPILTRIVGGIIFGAVFAALYDYLPGRTTVKKGVMFSAFLWILGAVWLIYTTPGWPTSVPQISAMPGITVRLSSVGLTLISIVFSLAFGALVGAIWSKLGGKQVTEVRNGSAALLISFTLGGLMWASGAVAFLINVVIRGLPVLPEPEPFWWYNMLAVLVVFPGLPGWILALIAWRKTRRDETGFKCGLAGGIVMTLTGIMLLPGVLAIIGGVLSRRKAAANIVL